MLCSHKDLNTDRERVSRKGAVKDRRGKASIASGLVKETGGFP